MLELCAQEFLCPSCRDSVYPQHRVVKKVLCGDENICYPPSKNYSAPDCKVYYFCSDKCARDLESRISACRPVSRWKRLMARINEVSKTGGIAGAWNHHLHKNK